MSDTIGVYIPAGAKPCRIVKLPREGFNDAVYKLLNIDCYDIVRLPMDDRTIMLVDDEGYIRESPYNARASILSRYPADLSETLWSSVSALSTTVSRTSSDSIRRERAISSPRSRLARKSGVRQGGAGYDD